MGQLKTVQEEVTTLRSTVKAFETEYQRIKDELAASRYKNLCLKENILQLDTYSRRENLRFTGILEDNQESSTLTEKKVRDVLVNTLKLKNGSKMYFQRCHRTGPAVHNDSDNRDILVRLAFFPDRQKVWDNRKLLKGSSIYINEDFPPEIAKRRSKLYPVVKAARQRKIKASLVADRLIIEGRRYTVDRLDDLPDELKLKNIAKREYEDTVLFFGKHSCYSNFYQVDFILDGTRYTSSEQYLQQQKALRAGDKEAAQRIMKTTEPAEQQRIGKRVKPSQEKWNNKTAKQVLEVGVKTKFEQNPNILAELLSTGGKAIAECNKRDKFWGIGLGLDDKSVNDKTKWKGENALGEILIRVREGLK